MPAHTIYCWYIVDNSVKEVYCVTWKSHFGCFRLFRGCFRPFRGCFRPKKKNIIKKRRTSPTEHFFSPGSSTRILSEYLKIWIKYDKITFRLSFQFPPQADIWGQAEIQALWKIQVYVYIYIYIYNGTIFSIFQSLASPVFSNQNNVKCDQDWSRVFATATL